MLRLINYHTAFFVRDFNTFDGIHEECHNKNWVTLFFITGTTNWSRTVGVADGVVWSSGPRARRNVWTKQNFGVDIFFSFTLISTSNERYSLRWTINEALVKYSTRLQPKILDILYIKFSSTWILLGNEWRDKFQLTASFRIFLLRQMNGLCMTSLCFWKVGT